jgi:hypothetical protein
MADMNVYIYPNTSNEDSLAQGAYDAISAALAETFAYPAMEVDGGTYHVEIDYSYPNLNDPDKDAFKDNFEDWTWLNASGNGVHLALSSNWGGGVADSGESLEGTGWGTEVEAVAGQPDGQVTGHFKGIAIQEAYHPFIDKRLQEIQNLMGPSGDEHSLGRVNSNNRVTPMVTSYQDEGYDDEGTCSSDGYDGGHTTSPTYCTNQAIHQTYQDRVLGES